MGRLATPADVAAACVMLASPALAYVTGADLFVDGGGEIPAFHTASWRTEPCLRPTSSKPSAHP